MIAVSEYLRKEVQVADVACSTENFLRVPLEYHIVPSSIIWYPRVPLEYHIVPLEYSRVPKSSPDCIGEYSIVQASMRAAAVQPRGRQVPDDPQRRELPQVFAARRFLPPAREYP